MLYIIWGLLNIGALIYFSIISFKVVKIVRVKMGLFATIFFVIIILSFIGNTNKDTFGKRRNAIQTNTWNNTSADSLIVYSSYLSPIKMESNFVTNYYLEVLLGRDKSNRIVPKSAFTSCEGLIAGTKWTPKSIEIKETTKKNEYSFSVLGEVDWHLLGTTIYLQQKRFEGIIFTDISKHTRIPISTRVSRLYRAASCGK